MSESVLIHLTNGEIIKHQGTRCKWVYYRDTVEFYDNQTGTRRVEVVNHNSDIFECLSMKRTLLIGEKRIPAKSICYFERIIDNE